MEARSWVATKLFDRLGLLGGLEVEFELWRFQRPHLQNVAVLEVGVLDAGSVVEHAVGAVLVDDRVGLRILANDNGVLA